MEMVLCWRVKLVLDHSGEMQITYSVSSSTRIAFMAPDNLLYVEAW